MTVPSGAWHPDPYGRHQLRWWDGAQWTAMVSDNGVSRDENAPQYVAPVPAPVAPPVAPPMVPVMPTSMPAAPSGGNRGLVIALVVAVALVAVGVIVRFTRSDDNSSGAAKGDSQTAAGREYVDALVEAASADNTTGFTTDEMTCIAETMVDRLGVAALQDAGITPEVARTQADIDISGIVTQAQAEQMADDVAKCIDFSRLVGDELVGSDVLFTEAQAGCIGDKLGESDLIREMFVQGFMGSETQPSLAAAEALGVEVVGCIDFGQMIADVLATSGVQLDAATTTCIGDGMNASVFVRQMFTEQFLASGGDTDSSTVVPSTMSAANEMLSSIVGSLFGATDAATTDALTREMSDIFTNCGVDLGG